MSGTAFVRKDVTSTTPGLRGQRIALLRQARQRLHRQAERAEALRGCAAAAGHPRLAQALIAIADRAGDLQEACGDWLRSEGVELAALRDVELDHAVRSSTRRSDLALAMSIDLRSDDDWVWAIHAEELGWAPGSLALLREIGRSCSLGLVALDPFIDSARRR